MYALPMRSFPPFPLVPPLSSSVHYALSYTPTDALISRIVYQLICILIYIPSSILFYFILCSDSYSILYLTLPCTSSHWLLFPHPYSLFLPHSPYTACWTSRDNGWRDIRALLLRHRQWRIHDAWRGRGAVRWWHWLGFHDWTIVQQQSWRLIVSSVLNVWYRGCIDIHDWSV